MADQVNPLGSLAAGVAQTLQVLSSSSSARSPSSARSADSEAPSTESLAASADDFAVAAKSVSDFLQQSSTETRYGVDQQTGLYYFKIIDAATKETIRQVPPEEVLSMARRLREFLNSSKAGASGILMDQQG